jgi:hypothetical protein
VGTKSANKIRHKETKEKGAMMIGPKTSAVRWKKNWKVEGWIEFVWSVGGLPMDSLVLFVIRVAW